jgi:CHY zinc finger
MECRHHSTGVSTLYACCSGRYMCVKCHDEGESHRREGVQMECNTCLLVQEPSARCRKCRRTVSEYFCSTCIVWGAFPAFHCKRCGACRKGREDLFFHCEKCNACMEVEHRGDSLHLENALKGSCPICMEPLDGGKKCIALTCGHPLHESCHLACLDKMHHCPTCFSLSGDLLLFNEKARMLVECSPRGGEVVIFCYVCRKNRRCRETFIFYQCPECDSFNTRKAQV